MLSQRCAAGCNSICCDTVKVTPEQVCAAFWMSCLSLLHAELEAPVYLLVGLAHHVVVWESSKALNIFFEVLLEFQCCIFIHPDHCSFCSITSLCLHCFGTIEASVYAIDLAIIRRTLNKGYY